MTHEGQNGNDQNPEATEQQLRRQVEELRRQLRERNDSHTGVPEVHWKPSSVTIIALALGALVIMVGAFFAGYLPLQRRDALVRAESTEQARELPRMEVMRVERSAGGGELQLPGTLQAITEAPILARADGYLKRRLVDLGDHVRAGQLLAEIDAPEVSQQIRQADATVAQAEASFQQAQASLEQGKADRDLAKINAERWKTLSSQGVVSILENDQHQSALLSANANVQALEKAIEAQRSNILAAKANLARLQDVQSYLQVKAPFDGVITVRNVDTGALVSTGTTLLYRVAQTGTLRTYVNLPQIQANAVRVGQAAHLSVENFPGRPFTGRVARTANALDPASRTMLVEIEVPNARGELLPGMFAQVDLSSIRAHPPLTIPAQALVLRADGAQVAIVRPDGSVHLQKVQVGRDYGDRVEVLQGLDEGATILASSGDVSQEGTRIQPVPVANIHPEAARK